MKKIILVVLLLVNGFFIQVNSYAFTRIVDLVFDGEPVEPDKLQEIFATIKKNRAKNKNIKNPKKLKPDKLFTVYARQPNPKDIQLEVDTSGTIVKSEGDIQLPISNQGFLNAVTEAIMLWDDVDIANVDFAPLKFASLNVDPEDGRNVITFRVTEAPEGTPEIISSFTIVTYAKTSTIIYMNQVTMIKPGTILDADTIFDPNNEPCLALHTTTGAFKIGGDDLATISEGGVPQAPVAPNPPTQQFVNLQNCELIIGGDITDLTVVAIGYVLGLAGSGIGSSATFMTALIRNRYPLTNDDKIGLANLYPNKENLINTGTLTGRVLLKKKPVRGANVVIENLVTGEPIASAITNLGGRFFIRAIPAGFYNVYAEPVDGPARKRGFNLTFFGFNPDLNFTTGVYPTPIIIEVKKRTNITIKVKELSASAFNINFLTAVLTEEDVNESGGQFLLPIMIMAGETINRQFWGSNISTGFGQLSVSGSGITLSNIMDGSIPISPFVKCDECQEDDPALCPVDPRCSPPLVVSEEPDEVQGFTADITCAIGTPPGPRNIIFTGEQLNVTHPSFGLRDQITGGLVVTE